MSDYRQEGTGKVITEQELLKLAAESGFSVEELIQENNLKLITEDSGNTTGAATTTANVVPTNQIADTDLTLENGLSESQDPDPKSKYYVTPEELSKGSEEDIAPFLNKKLSRLGITVDQATALGSLDAISLSNIDQAAPSPSFLIDLIKAIKVGENQSEEDLKASANAINEYIKQSGNLDFLNTSTQEEFDTYENYVKQIQAPSLTKEELNSKLKDERLQKFLNKDAETTTISFKEYRDSGLMKPEEAKFYKGSGFKTVKKEATKEDFDSESEFKAYKEWQKNGFVKDADDSEISFYDNERKVKYALDKSSEYVSGLDPKQRTSILALASQDEEKISNFTEEANSLFNTKENLEVALDNYSKNKTKENYLQAFELQSSYLKQQNDVQRTQAALEASGAMDREKAVPFAIDDFNRNYDRLDQLVSATKSMGTDIMYSMAQLSLLRDPYTYAKLAAGTKISTLVEKQTGLVSLGRDMQKEMENFQRAIAVDEINSVKDAGRWVAGSIPNLLPSLGMAMTGPAAMPLFFLSGAGGKGMEMAIKQKEASERMVNNNKLLKENPNMDPLERASIETQMNKDADILKIEDWKILSNQALAGVAEVAFERIGTMRLLKGLKDGVKMLPPQTVKEGFEFVGKQLEKGFRVEGGSEFGTTVFQNIGDVYFLNEDKNVFEGGLESFSQGALMGGGIAAVTAFKGVKQAVISELANKAEVDELFNITSKLRKLTNIEIQGPSDPALKNLNLPKETQQTVNDLVKKGQALENGVLFKIGTDLSPEALKKVGEVNKKIRRLNKRLIDAYANPNIKASELSSIEKVLRGEFNELAGEREQILTNETDIKAARKNAAAQGVSFDSSIGYQLYREKMLAESTQYVMNDFANLSPEAKQAEVDEAIELLKAEKKEGAKEPTTKEINQKALNNYVNKTYKARIKKGQANAQKFAEDIGLDVEFIVAETKEETIQAIKDTDPAILKEEAYKDENGKSVTVEKAIELGQFEGQQIGDSKIVINLETSVKNKRTGVFAHEVLHAYAKKFFNKNQKSIDAAGESLLTYLQKNQPDLYAKVKFRIDESYADKNIEGELVKQKDYYEEAMNAMSDVLADGQKVTESTIDRIRFFANKFLPSKIQLKDGESAYYFVKDYNKASHFGGKTVQDPIVKTAVSKEDEKLTEDKLSITKFNQQLEQLETDYDNNEIDFDVYEQQKANLEGKIKRAEKAEATAVSEKPKTVAKPKPAKESNQVLKESTAKSKKELDDIGNNPDGFNKDNPKIYTILRGLIKSKSLVFKTKKGNIVNLNSLPGFNMDNMVSETIANMLPYVAKFDPKQNNSLFGYLMAQLNNRMKGALNTGRVTDSAFDVDVSEAKGITASETTAPAVPEKTKYKNLVQQKVLSTDGLKTVRDKVISSVRVLKSKFDASVTKNVSVPPIIAEIKKDIGKQADIVLKKEMGGIKNNELQNYLKANKKAILENMTTFYLTKAFPEAIQKSVGGKYLLDKDGKRVINTFGDATFVPNFVNSDVWKGAKIDREKTSTEAKGKTSGNEIIRRVPNISQAISDELFLSSIIGPDGKPIRGRKESLAKAMGEEIAFDIINQDLKTDGPISEALRNNQKALGVDITEHFEEELSRQIERGNIKFSITLNEGNKILEEGLAILENNGFEQLSSEFLGWKNNSDYKEVVDIWEEYYQDLFLKTDAAVRKTFTKAKKEYQNKFTYLKDALDNFEEGGLNSIYPAKKALALSQLENFWNIISERIDPAVAAIKGSNFLGAVSRTSKPSKSIETNLKSKPKKVSKEVQEAFNNLKPVLKNVRIYSGSGFALNAVKDFVTNFKGNPADAVNEFNKSELGKETRLAKEANILLFKYLNALALDAVLEQKNKADVNKAFTGYLRWLETNNNNDAGLKGLAYVMGFEVLSDQAIYTDSKGKKYYSKKSGMDIVDGSKKLTKGQLKINKNHSSWKAATKAMEQLIVNSKPQKQKEWKQKNQFEKDQAIAALIQLMGEHQQSMGETGIRLAEAVGNVVESVFANNISKKEAFNIYNLKVNAIASEFGIVLNSRFISEIQDKKFGKTSKLGKSRLFVLPKNIKDNIVSLQGDLIYEQGKKELTNIFKNVIKAQELSAENNKIESSKKEKSTSDKLSLTKEFNSIIERNKGVAADVTYSKIVAKRMGANIGKYKFYIPSSAEDFRLLTSYTFSGKGKQGTKDMAWFNKNLIRPYTEGVAAIDVAKQTTKNDFKTLNKAMPNIAKTIGDLIPTKDYTNDQAVRVYLWNKAGYAVPGLNEKEVGVLVAYVAGNPELALYAESLLAISKSNEWLKPSEHWDVGTILSDINNLTEKGGRKAYLAEWIENVDEIFSDQNLNKIEALYGKRHVEALKDSLYRMKNGTNRPSGSNAQVNKWNNWLNNSIGSIMFFNRRSALLQLLSTSNFLNWSDNNPVKAAAAFANQKQYWKDFSTLFNSDKLKQRRGGLRADVNEAEIANEAANSKNKATAALSWLLKKGFTPTQIADSFAIASGGATFYRNRINTYLNQKDAEGNNLYTEKQAEDKAFLDFIEVSDQSQQSSDPSLVSMEQASVLGRLVLAFQNTTQQYSRIMKRSALDIIKRRQMPGTTSMLQSDFSNFSKIMYYGAIQNLIFNSLSAAIFALIPGFGEEEEEEEINKSTAEKLKRITNGSIDSILRGIGVKGAVVAQIKNTIMEYFKQKDKGFTGDQTYTIIQVANLSPPIGSKLKKIYGAIRGYQYNEKLMKERGFDLTANGKLNLSPSYSVLGSLSAGVANIPLDRMYAEIQSVGEMLDNRNTIYQRLALSLGFRTWDVNVKNEEDDLIKAQIKETKKIKQKEKAKAKRVDAARQKIIDRRKAYESLTEGQRQYILSLGKNARKKALDKVAKQLKEK